MLIINLEKKVQEKAKKVFAMKGSIKVCAEQIKVDRTTISRVVKNGTGEERTVNAIAGYVKSMRVA